MLFLEAWGWHEFTHGPSLYSYLSLSLWLLLSNSLSYFSPGILSVSEEIAKPVRFSDSFTGCPGWTMTEDLSLPAAQYNVANKLAANYLSNTCRWKCWGSPLIERRALPYDQKSLPNDRLPLFAINNMCQYYKIQYQLRLDVMQIVSDTRAVKSTVLAGTNKFSVQLN